MHATIYLAYRRIETLTYEINSSQINNNRIIGQN